MTFPSSIWLSVSEPIWQLLYRFNWRQSRIHFLYPQLTNQPPNCKSFITGNSSMNSSNLKSIVVSSGMSSDTFEAAVASPNYPTTEFIRTKLASLLLENSPIRSLAPNVTRNLFEMSLRSVIHFEYPGMPSLEREICYEGEISPNPLYALKDMEIKSKFGLEGEYPGMFNSPHGFCLGFNDEIVVADTFNHRIQVFSDIGDFRFEFGIPGREDGRLWHPRKIAFSKFTGNFIVCDRGCDRSRMQIFRHNGLFVRKIIISYINIVAGLAISLDGNIVAVDSVSPTVYVISEQDGMVQKVIDCNSFMKEPSDIAIFDDKFYVCDFKGHAVYVMDNNGSLISKVGSEEVTPFPNGIEISDEGDIIVGDSHGNQFHVAIYSSAGFLIGQFTCPSVKVSRCCGLKITPGGDVVTLAKNNNYVLVLNTLFVN